MPRLLPLLFISLSALAGENSLAQFPASPQTIEFEKHIAPIFGRCMKCHDAERHKGGFDLSQRETAMKGGKNGPAIVVKESAKSPLVEAVARLDADSAMPPQGKGAPLTKEEVGLVRAWIDQGANWPQGFTVVEPSGLANHDLWSLKPIQRVEPPKVSKKPWNENPIDRFILARLEREKLAPNKEADRATLIRRVSHDLTGLPPTPEEIKAFVEDKSKNAYERLIDRLLSSPHYGERWARHWLDVARFAESDGFERDKLRENSWRYRDYVIRSVNDDKPYDQFAREQIAGDVIEPVTPDGIIATGFLVAGPWDEVGAQQVSTLMKARVREEDLEDVVSAVGQTFLAMTVNCARCHDHKFDPIPQRDYYRLKCAFEGVFHGERPIQLADSIKREAEAAENQKSIAQLEKQISEMEREAIQKALAKRNIKADRSAHAPISRWTFDGDARDSIGALHGKLEGSAKIENGKLKVDGKSFTSTAALTKDLREKTLEAWVVLPTLKQGGGGVISVQTIGGGNFDSIVFGERQPNKWIAGSTGFQRTKDLSAPEETSRPNEAIHIAIVYAADDTITLYRNGAQYGEPYKAPGDTGKLQTYSAQKSQIVLGLRHTGAGNGLLNGEIEEARLYDRALNASEVLASFNGAPFVSQEEMLAQISDEQKSQRKTAQADLDTLRARFKGLQAKTLTYAANPKGSPQTFVLARGDIEKKAERVSAGGLSAIKTINNDFGLAPDAPESQRRLKFAEWLTDPKNPLPARVLANRVWHYHFGRGISGTPSDFGVNGDKPAHPELLDWLAAEFVREGWSLKKLHKTILLSQTYRQSSKFNEKFAAIDADNRLLWRFTPRRLDAECVRDAMLAITGQLNTALGGPSFKPFETKVNNSNFYTLTDSAGPAFNRRTIYRMCVNSAKDPLLDTLDCPDPSTKTPVRSMTTTPLQALSLMNNAFVIRQSRFLAERVRKERGNDVSAQIRGAFLLAFGREPEKPESEQFERLAREQGLENACWVLFNASEFSYVK